MANKYVTKENTRTIIAAIDVSHNASDAKKLVKADVNLEILKSGLSLAAFRGYSLKVVSIWSAQYENILKHSIFMNQNEDEVDRYVQGIETQQVENLKAFMDRAKESLGQGTFDFINPEVISIKGNPVVAIPEYANEINAELVVIGTATSTNESGEIMSGTAENILYQLNQSVFGVKPSGFDSSLNK